MQPRLLLLLPLVDYLATRAEGEVVLTLDGIEAIIGAPLPDSAYTGTSYWASMTVPHVRRLRMAGWYARLDRPGRCIAFTRAGEWGAPEPPTSPLAATVSHGKR